MIQLNLIITEFASSFIKNPDKVKVDIIDLLTEYAGNQSEMLSEYEVKNILSQYCDLSFDNSFEVKTGFEYGNITVIRVVIQLPGEDLNNTTTVH